MGLDSRDISVIFVGKTTPRRFLARRYSVDLTLTAFLKDQRGRKGVYIFLYVVAIGTTSSPGRIGTQFLGNKLN